MYVISARNKRVSIELLGKLKIEDKMSRFDELTSASLSYLGVSFLRSPDRVSSTLPNIKELDLTGNLLAHWEDVKESFDFLGTPEGDIVHPVECMQQLFEQVRHHNVKVDGNVCTMMVTILVREKI